MLSAIWGGGPPVLNTLSTNPAAKRRVQYAGLSDLFSNQILINLGFLADLALRISEPGPLTISMQPSRNRGLRCI